MGMRPSCAYDSPMMRPSCILDAHTRLTPEHKSCTTFIEITMSRSIDIQGHAKAGVGGHEWSTKATHKNCKTGL